jgi:hypothetical protein
MAAARPRAADLLDLPLEVLTGVCLQLDLHDLVRVAAMCKRFRHGDGGLETVELPTKAPVVMAMREHAFPSGVLIPNTRPIGCSESWVAYLTRCARQRRCREAPPVAARGEHTLVVDAAGRLLASGDGVLVGHGDRRVNCSLFKPLVAMAEIWVRSVAAGMFHSIALGWDGLVYSWGLNFDGQLGHKGCGRPSPALVEGIESVRSIEATYHHSVAVTQSGAVVAWGAPFRPGARLPFGPIIVEGFGGVRVRRVCCEYDGAFPIGEDGEVFSWGRDGVGRLGHGAAQDQLSPKRVKALRGLRVSSVAVGAQHALALTEDGLV